MSSTVDVLHVNAGIMHPQRPEDVALYVIGPRLAAHRLDDQSRQRVGEVRVLPPHLGSERRLAVGDECPDLRLGRELQG
jgi:hypothetical protein